jgi:hypothetical protein
MHERLGNLVLLQFLPADVLRHSGAPTDECKREILPQLAASGH